MGKSNYRYLKKYFGIFTLSIASLASFGNAFGSDDGQQVYEIAQGRNYLALTSAEIVRAYDHHSEQEAKGILQDKANQRADALCGARGFLEVGAPPVLKDAAPNLALGPWKDNYSGLVRTDELNQAYSEADLVLKQSKYESLVRHKYFSSLQCRVILR